MLSSPEQTLLREAQPLSGAENDYDGLLDQVGDASVVLLGEASHGTHEFYRERARITRRLIEERGFQAVAVEADWPDAYRVNRYVHGAPDDGDAEEALRGFRRFPPWMWRNAEVSWTSSAGCAPTTSARTWSDPRASSGLISTASTPRSPR
jgi:erythromycin esterase-like protein